MAHVTTHIRADLDAVQRSLRDYEGPSVLIYDQVCDQIHILTQGFDISPIAQAGVYHRMVDRIEASIRAVNGIIEWENMNAAK